MTKFYLQNQGEITIGDNFYCSSGEGINPISRNLRGCIFVAKGAKLTIGSNVGISSGTLWVSQKVTIGSDVMIGANCLIIDTDSHPLNADLRCVHHPTEEDVRAIRQATKSAPVVIEDKVWLGTNVMVLKGVRIGRGSVIGAGSVVSKSIPEGCIAAGNPCRVIRRLEQ